MTPFEMFVVASWALTCYFYWVWTQRFKRSLKKLRKRLKEKKKQQKKKWKSFDGDSL